MQHHGLTRQPPVSVRRKLRQEVGFGCPVPGCSNPYLEYHHFDPPWEIEQHHDPDRMIALCATHHAKAKAWTINDVRRMKAVNRSRADVRGRFEWMRDDVLAVVGGNYYYETPKIIVSKDNPVVWFERDDERRLLLSLRMLTVSGLPRAQLDGNDWMIDGDPEDVESPPNGSRLRIKYSDGDDIAIQFREWQDKGSLGAAHAPALRLGDKLRFPLVTVEITMAVGGTDFRLNAQATNVGGLTMTGCVMSHCGTGLAFG